MKQNEDINLFKVIEILPFLKMIVESSQAQDDHFTEYHGST